MKKITKIIPQLLVSNLNDFKKRLKLVEDYVKIVQIDVMDGNFVDNITYADINKIKRLKTPVQWELHLMVEDPLQYITKWRNLTNVKTLISHYEASNNLNKVLDAMKGKQKGIALQINTDPLVLKPFINKIDYVLLMTVKIGFSGQEFEKSVLKKVKILKKMKKGLLVAVDGGVNDKTITVAKKAGVDYFGANSYIFQSKNPLNRIIKLNQLAT
jgi:ribulose-phosphate 3-epimerase